MSLVYLSISILVGSSRTIENVVLNVTFFSCPPICSHAIVGKAKTKTLPPPPLTMTISITVTNQAVKSWETSYPQRSGRKYAHTYTELLSRTCGECTYKMFELLVSWPFAQVAPSFLMLKETKIVVYFDTRGEVYFCNEDWLCLPRGKSQ